MSEEDLTANQRERRFRATARSSSLQAQANQAFAKAHDMASIIPFGQPMLRDHYSYGRDRRYRDKIHRNMVKGCELQKAAQRAEYSVSRAGLAIMSDDPEALEALTAKLERLEATHAKMVAANKLVRKKNRAGLVALGLSENQADKLLEPNFAGRLGFPPYAIQNSNANIKRVRERIEELRRKAEAPAMEPMEGAGWKLYEDVEAKRICFEFDGKPAADTIKALKGAAFKWAPSRGEWIRLSSNGAIYHARELAKKLGHKEPGHGEIQGTRDDARDGGV